MSVIEKHADNQLVIYNKGAPEVVLEKCSMELLNGQPQSLSEQRKNEILAQSSQMAGRALRVLGLAYRPDPVQLNGEFEELELVFAGLVGMIDPPREEVKVAVEECFAAGIRPVMITGDHPDTALAIGRELNIALPDSKAVTGVELDLMSDEQLEKRVESNCGLRAGIRGSQNASH